MYISSAIYEELLSHWTDLVPDPICLLSIASSTLDADQDLMVWKFGTESSNPGGGFVLDMHKLWIEVA